uniref:CSON003706 protein n=1 Tax=Culicoides sonorensis TaxID=179676 RepID=A0A336LJN2_CULSO
MKCKMFILNFALILCIGVNLSNSDDGVEREERFLSNKAPPHIVFIMADDLGWNDVSYNDPVHQIPTPNIDALGLNGIILNRHYSTHMCTPSRAALMTGEYPIHNGMHHWVIDADEPWALPIDRKIMPQYFKAAGYETYMVGKWHLGFHKTEYTPLERGFDHHYGYWGPYIDYWTKTMIKLDRPYNRGLDFRQDFNLIRDTNDSYATYMFSDAAVSYIEQHDRRRPMLMVVNHLAPHTANEDDPMQAPQDQIDKFSHISDPKRRIMAAMTSIMDEGIGNVVTALKKQKMLDNSIIVFISDNGAPTIGLHSNLGSNYPLRGQKNSPWEGGTRTPAVIYSPLIQKSRRVSYDLFHITDWLPTLLSAAGISIDRLSKRKIDGINQWPSLTYGVPGRRREALLNINPIEGWSGLIKDDWKLVNKSNQPKTDIWLSKLNYESQFPDDVSYAEYVVSSDTNVAIGNHLRESQIVDMLKHNRVNCEVPPNKQTNRYHCDLSKKSYCLFNIRRDPCEFYDISDKYPKQLSRMFSTLNQFSNSMVPSLYKPTDPNCNPLYYNDTWGFNDVSFRDSVHQIPTPNIDALGLNGVILNRHYSMHMCTPSRAALMTEYTPLKRGFDHHYGYYGATIDYYSKEFSVLRIPSNGFDFRNEWNIENDNETYVTELLTESAVKYIKSHDKENPMFMVVNHLAPHSADIYGLLQAPQQEIDKFNFIPNLRRRTYAAMVSLLDKSIGNVITALNENGLLKNSVVVFLSDNGGTPRGGTSNSASNFPLRGLKGFPWEGSVRTPAFIWSPLIKSPKRVSNDLFHISDWFPTLLNIARIDSTPIKNKIDGVNQWPSISEGLPTTRKELLVNIDTQIPFKAIIRDDWKLVVQESQQFDGWLSTANKHTGLDEESYFEKVIQSEAYIAIDGSLSQNEVFRLTEESRLHCREPTEYDDICDPIIDKCLFNIQDDPCERFNLAADFPMLVRELEESLEIYEQEMLPSINQPSDLNADPALHKYTWTYWNSQNDNKTLKPNFTKIYLVVNMISWRLGLLLSIFINFINVSKQLNSKPNIIIIVADDLGWNDVSYHDPVHQIPTPNIDALGINGLILNRHYSMQMCTPSRSALMTGKYPINIGMQHFVIVQDEPWGLPLDQKLMPEYFKEAGYRTYMVGKWHLGFHKKDFTPLQRGFDHHYGYWGSNIDYWNKFKTVSPNSPGLDFRNDSTLIYDDTKYATESFTDITMKFIDNHDKSKPMFLVVNHLAPHTANVDDPLQAPEDEIAKFSFITDKSRRKHVAMVSLLDKSVGKIVSSLHDNGMLQDSIIVFLSDNGAPTESPKEMHPGSNYPLRGTKNTPWEGGVRVPAVIWSPRFSNHTSKVHNGLFHISDWLPTLLKASDIQFDENKFDGINQWTNLINNSDNSQIRTELLINIDPIDNWSSIIMDEFKLLYKSVRDQNDGWLNEPNVETNLTQDTYLETLIRSDIHRILKSNLTKDDILKIVQSAVVKCPKSHDMTKNCNETKNVCLFNINEDPCEFYDISSENQEKVQILLEKLKQYERTMKNPLNQPRDPASDPINHNLTWISWNDRYNI